MLLVYLHKDISFRKVFAPYVKESRGFRPTEKLLKVQFNFLILYSLKLSFEWTRKARMNWIVDFYNTFVT